MKHVLVSEAQRSLYNVAISFSNGQVELVAVSSLKLGIRAIPVV